MRKSLALTEPKESIQLTIDDIHIIIKMQQRKAPLLHYFIY